MSEKNDLWMNKAIHLAKRGIGRVSPNPPVGAVLVDKNIVIASAYHQQYGGAHAEVLLLRKVKKISRQAILFITMEPCSTFGKTPPCVDQIIQSGIKKVVIGVRDPNPVNRNKGIRKLQKYGIHVEVGPYQIEIERLLRPFAKYMIEGYPWCTLKVGLSLDGKIATVNGESKWITGVKSRENVQRLRQKVDAIAVGIDTVLKDDPSLSIKKISEIEPKKVVFDTHLRIPLRSKLIRLFAKNTIVVTSVKESPKLRNLEKKGVKIIKVALKNGKTSLRPAFRFIAKMGIQHLLLEGGGMISASALEEKLIDEVYFYFAPILIGGKDAPTPVDGKGIMKLALADTIEGIEVEKIGRDILIKGRVKRI